MRQLRLLLHHELIANPPSQASNIVKLPVLPGQARPDDSLGAESNLSDERHEAEDTTPKDEP